MSQKKRKNYLFFNENLSRTIIYSQLRSRARSSQRRFLIPAVVGTPFVPVFSSGQFVSIRGTKNPSCIQPLKPPLNHRRATVWPCDYAYMVYVDTYIYMCMDPLQSLQPLSSSEWNHGSTCRFVGLKIKGFKGRVEKLQKKRKSR